MQRLLRSFVVVALVAALPIGLAAPSAAGGDVPERIVSLSPTTTEMLFAIGAGDQVIAVDQLSNYPTDAPVTDLDAYTPNIEAIAGYQPDLVVVTDNTAVDGLEALDIETLVLAGDDVRTVKDIYKQLKTLGRATGHVREAKKVIAGMKADITDILEDVPEDGDTPTAYYELDNTYFSADSSTFIGQILELGGFANIADEADSDGSGYPQLSAEFIIDADPDAIFLADTLYSGESAETVAARPGFGELQAVQEGRVFALNDDIASRWSPRIVELLRVIVKARAEL